MAGTFGAIVDRSLLGVAIESLCDLEGIAATVYEMDGTPLASARWQRVCARFHRDNPATSQACALSDAHLRAGVLQGQEIVIHACANGLVDAASVVRVEGVPLAYVVAGQFLLETPAPGFLEAQADRAGIDRGVYLEALASVPVIARERLEALLRALTGLCGLVGGLGESHRRERETERALARSQAAYGVIFNQSPVSITLRTLDGRYTDANPRFLAATGRTREDVIGRTPVELGVMEPARYETMVEALDRGGGSLDQFETESIRADGSRQQISMTAGKVMLDKVTHIVTFVTTITERKRVEEALRQSEGRLRTMVESLPAGMAFVDLEGAITDANPALASLVDRSRDELCTMRFLDLVPGSSAMTQDHGYANYDTELVTRGGTKIPVALTVWTVKDSAGSPRFLVYHVQDVTQQRKAETERRQLEAQLIQAQKLEAVGQLAGGIAHDLNNMLTPIVGYAALLRDRVEPGDPRRRPAEHILEAGTRSRDLVRRLLTFARRQPVDLRPLDLNTIVTDLERMLRRTLPASVQIRRTLHPGVVSVRGDAGQIEQIILNLAVNARDAMPEGGTLTLETAVEPSPPAVAGTEPLAMGPYAVLTVSDTGMGMEPVVLTRIFEPFFTTKPQGRGTGLGLPTVYGIVKQHGGAIVVRSEVGVGSVFRVYLPLREQPRIPPTPVETAPVRGGAETVLVVEDQAAVREFVVDALRSAGYTVLEAEDVTRGIALAARHLGRIDLLLADVSLPDGTAFALRQALPGGATVPVLYMSGHSAETVSQEGMIEAGGDLLQKPFTTEALTARTRSILDRRART